MRVTSTRRAALRKSYGDYSVQIARAGVRARGARGPAAGGGGGGRRARRWILYGLREKDRL